MRDLLAQDRSPIAELLEKTYPLKPVVVQRHYTTTGTLRYFEQRYGDSRLQLKELTCSSGEYDGAILYWLDRSRLESPPATTKDGKPLVVVEIARLDVLRTRAEEFQALQKIWQTAPELQTDGVAEREVKQRLLDAERLLDETVRQVFDWAGGENRCWMDATLTKIPNARAFQSALSDICDRTYAKTPILDNELINRRALTSQGAKARRELIEAAIASGDRPRLGLESYGPEVAMYFSVLEATGIHRQEDELWGFYPPHPNAGIKPLWDAIESFCLEAKDKQLSLELLYQRLQQPPYGIKQGMVPIVLVAVLLYRVDDVGFYKDGTFVPVMGPEHFELLVKDPSRFSVKYFEMVGLRSQVFRELENILRSPNRGKSPTKTTQKLRNASLLAVVKPLFAFARKLPKYTLGTQRISQPAQNVLTALQTAQEPDDLLFVSLPQACDFPPMTTAAEDATTAKAFRKKLVNCFHEIQTAYEVLLNLCQTRFYEAFGVRQTTNLREDLQVQAAPLVGKCIEPVLKRFILAAVDENAPESQWLEALAMIVADKPPKSWSDNDITRFELALSDLVRRFKQLEALQKEVEAKGAGFAAKRLTITQQDGHEINQVIWIDTDQEALLDQVVNDVLKMEELQGNPKLQQAFIAKFSERILGAQQQSDFAKPRKSRRRSAL